MKSGGYRYISDIISVQSVMHCPMFRAYTKSKESESYVNSRSASSISNLTFAGIHCGWTGLGGREGQLAALIPAPDTTEKPHVHPNDLRLWKFLRHFYGPDPGSCCELLSLVCVQESRFSTCIPVPISKILSGASQIGAR
jgi:hypothetical protein